MWPIPGSSVLSGMGWPQEVPACNWATFQGCGEEGALVCPEHSGGGLGSPSSGWLNLPIHRGGAGEAGWVLGGDGLMACWASLRRVSEAPRLPTGTVGWDQTSVPATYLALGSGPSPCPGSSCIEANVRGQAAGGDGRDGKADRRGEAGQRGRYPGSQVCRTSPGPSCQQEGVESGKEEALAAREGSRAAAKGD